MVGETGERKWFDVDRSEMIKFDYNGDQIAKDLWDFQDCEVKVEFRNGIISGDGVNVKDWSWSNEGLSMDIVQFQFINKEDEERYEQSRFTWFEVGKLNYKDFPIHLDENWIVDVQYHDAYYEKNKGWLKKEPQQVFMYYWGETTGIKAFRFINPEDEMEYLSRIGKAKKPKAQDFPDNWGEWV